VPRQVVVITGAAGFLGSAITKDLATDHSVVAIDRREPGQALRDATPGVDWHRLDIAEHESLRTALRAARRRLRRIDVLIHLAAYYHFDPDWREEYRRTNVDGTSHVVDVAIENGVRRLIFASSMVAMRPAPEGAMLTERSPTAEILPYGKSKAIGERIVRRAAGRLPSITLRIGGVFSDWCELPPLYSLIEMWTGRSPLSRVVAGAGNSGIPYLHRDDLLQLVRRCIERHEDLASHEVFLASQHGTVRHRELFEIIRGGDVRPIFVSRSAARFGLALKMALGRVTGRMPLERPWMLEFVDRPWVADTTTTREKLGWDCDSRLDVRERLPLLLEHFSRDRPTWHARKAARFVDNTG